MKKFISIILIACLCIIAVTVSETQGLHQSYINYDGSWQELMLNCNVPVEVVNFFPQHNWNFQKALIEDITIENNIRSSASFLDSQNPVLLFIFNADSGHGHYLIYTQTTNLDFSFADEGFNYIFIFEKSN